MTDVSREQLREALAKAVEWAAGYPLGGDMDRRAAQDVYDSGQAALRGTGAPPEPSEHACDSAREAFNRAIVNWHWNEALRQAISAAYFVDFGRAGRDNDGRTWDCIECGTNVTGPSVATQCPKGCGVMVRRPSEPSPEWDRLAEKALSPEPSEAAIEAAFKASWHASASMSADDMRASLRAANAIDARGVAAPDDGRALRAALDVPAPAAPDVTRFEVIDHRHGAEPFGRVFSAWDCRIELSYQDGGRTLKVFVDGEAPPPFAPPFVDHLKGPEHEEYPT